jgi:serine phosphatase RsbU (regulator of sigma subunit)
MGNPYVPLTIDEYLRERLMPVEGAIPHVEGIEMYGNSIPAGTVGGDLFEYLNFQQRYDIDARIQRALKLSKQYLEPLPAGAGPRNSVDDHVNWLRNRPGYNPAMEAAYREARSSEEICIAEVLHELHTTAGVLLVDAQGHGIIAAKIASTVHDTFQALMLAELDDHGKTTPELFERINLRLALSVTARNALGISEQEGAQEIATMLYGELRPYGHFRFVNFGHPPPLVFSAEYRKFMDICKTRMVQFLPLGLHIPQDDPDRSRYLSLDSRDPADIRGNSSRDAELTLMSPGDIFVLYTDGVYDGSDKEEHQRLEEVMRAHYRQTPKEICNALLDYALRRDERLRQAGEQDKIDDKTVFIIKRN